MRRARLTAEMAVLGGAAVALLAMPLARAEEPSFSELQRGKYLVDAGDCVDCHTKDRDKPFAGGRAIPTPFGTIYSANITPDADTGIGNWSKDDFYRAMHDGVNPQGRRLYPAFPYPYFTKMTRRDVDAMRAYLATLKPIENAPPRNELTWPLNHRVLLRGWNWLNFEPGEFVPNSAKSEEWNRGAYLVEGPGHCGACHSPKNLVGGDKKDDALQGAPIQGWTAPKLTGNDRDGLGRWSNQDIVEYLKTGRNKFSGAAGLMAEVVEYSTSKLTDADLQAIAVYLKDQPRDETKQPDARPDAVAMRAGGSIYSDNCAACHAGNGEGVPRMFPPLKGNAMVQQQDATTVLHVILNGARTVPTDARPTPFAMPAFAWKLDDQQVADVANFVRNSWGNAGSTVTAKQAQAVRQSLDAEKATPDTSGTAPHNPTK